MTADKIVSALVMAGLFGLVILNPKGSVDLVKALGGEANDLVFTTQGGRFRAATVPSNSY